jgi:AcrR family transcriptional regulator
MTLATHPTGAPFAARRQRIVEAAARLFADAPYGEVHMDALAAEAGVAKPTLYRYFATKELLFIEALEQTLTKLRGDIEAIRAEPQPSETRLRRIVTLILNRIGRLAPAIQAAESASTDSATQSRRILRQGFRNLRQAIGGLVVDGHEEGLFGRVDPDLAALVILGGIRMAAHAQIGAHELADSMSDLFIHGLRSGGAPSRSAPALTTGAFA